MCVADILIIIYIIIGGIIGFKDGFTKSLTKFFGVIIAFLLSYLFKDIVSSVLMKYLPFFPFRGVIKGLTVLNIALYEMIAFALLFTVFVITIKVVIKVTGLLEKIITLTIVLGIPSKVLGSILGIIKNYITIFFIIYYLSMPAFYALSPLKNSKIAKPILKYTPFTSSAAKKMTKVIDEFENLAKKYEKSRSIDEFNLETLDLLLKYKVTTPSNVRMLIKSKKIKIKGVDKLLKKY